MSVVKKKVVADFGIMFAGSAIFAIAFNVFMKHSQIAVGGITGIAMVINYFVPWLTMGFLTLILNVPFLILGLRKINKTFMVKTIFASVVYSVVMWATDWIPPLTDDLLLCSIYGGVFIGIGMGLVLSRNGSTGGSDIIGCVLRARFPGISLGRLVLIADVIIVLCASFAFKNINSVLYAIIKMYVASIATDAVLYGLSYAKVAYIITEKAENITQRIIKDLGHSTTILDGIGGFTHQPRQMIMCAINQNQIGSFKEIVRENDPNAFVIVSNAHEVLGFGFKPNVKNFL